MAYVPDGYLSSDDEEGFSDDNAYFDYKQRIKQRIFVNSEDNVVSEAALKEQQLKAVYSAITFGRYEKLIEELDKGFDVNAVLENDWTPLLLSAATSSAKIVAEVLHRGADIHQKKDGSNALLYACNRCNDGASGETVFKIVKLLLEAGIDPNEVDGKRRIPIMLAATNGHLEVVKVLAPLCPKDAEDNQKWTTLFWAVDGNRIDVVKFLLDNGYSCDKVDIRENTVVELAHYNGFEEILDLLPLPDYNNEFFLILNNSQVNFEELFENLKENEKPQLFGDVCKILYGSKSENTAAIFADKQMSLLDFLSLTDAELKNLGIELPYQRSRILNGIYRLHEHSFNVKSIPFIPKKGLYTNIDVASTVLSVIKQLIVMEAGLKFMQKHNNGPLVPADAKELEELTRRLKSQLSRLKRVSDIFVVRTEQWDKYIKPADRITRKRRNIPWSSIIFTSVTISTVLLMYKLS